MKSRIKLMINIIIEKSYYIFLKRPCLPLSSIALGLAAVETAAAAINHTGRLCVDRKEAIKLWSEQYQLSPFNILKVYYWKYFFKYS